MKRPPSGYRTYAIKTVDKSEPTEVIGDEEVEENLLLYKGHLKAFFAEAYNAHDEIKNILK